MFEATITDYGIGGESKVVIIVNEVNGVPCEVFLRLAKHGSTLSGLLDTIAIIISKALQYGVPLLEICDWIDGMTFPPSGVTDDEDINHANSVTDYIAKKLTKEYG